MNEVDKIVNAINRIATVEGLIKPILDNALKSSPILKGNKQFAGSEKNMYELWVNNFGEKFFNMGTFIRLGSEIENGFRYYYMFKKNHSNNQDLNNDTAISQGVFQRLNGENSLQVLYKNELQIDLETSIDKNFEQVKEFMIARHLYTHRSGLLDDKFINDWKRQTGNDLASSQDIIKLGYPNEDVYWFNPLKDIWQYQKASVNTFKLLPK